MSLPVVKFLIRDVSDPVVTFCTTKGIRLNCDVVAFLRYYDSKEPKTLREYLKKSGQFDVFSW